MHYMHMNSHFFIAYSVIIPYCVDASLAVCVQEKSTILYAYLNEIVRERSFYLNTHDDRKFFRINDGS